MKKFAFAVAAAGLMSLAACNSQQAEQNEAAGEAVADNLAMQAEYLEDASENATNENTSMALENASENTEMAADNAEDAADNETDVN